MIEKQDESIGVVSKKMDGLKIDTPQEVIPKEGSGIGEHFSV